MIDAIDKLPSRRFALVKAGLTVAGGLRAGWVQNHLIFSPRDSGHII